MMTPEFSGKVAIVTGGTAGIGRRVTEILAERGATVFFSGRNQTRGAEVAEATGGAFLPFEAADESAAKSLVATVLDKAGKVDILVNNAGDLGAPKGVEDTTAAGLEATLAVHLKAPWMLLNGVVPSMRASGGGCIVNIASVAGHRVGASSAAYSVAKAAILHLSRCAAAEFGSDGIRVNSVSPGFVSTQIHAAAIEGDAERGERFVHGLGRLFLSRQALRHTGRPTDVAEIVVFLCSDASAFITGADIVADGGLIWGRAGLM